MTQQAFRMAYDGRKFYGYQRQPDVPTIEDALFDAFDDLDITNDSIPDQYSAAGRTDAGVSAIAQTFTCACPEWVGPSVLNDKLPASIQVWGVTGVDADFHATVDAEMREYTYLLWKNNIDSEVLADGMQKISGTHDFQHLTSENENTVRTIATELHEDSDHFRLVFRADGFVRHLVRRIVELLRQIATGDRSFADLEFILTADSLDGEKGVPAAPAYPLILSNVQYPNLSFATADPVIEDVVSAFQDKEHKHITIAAVQRSIWSQLK
ncbi:MAG: tRNA pseudouridine synthase A [Halobacteriaceae archaeon]